jgi:hypothetical protein
MPSMLDIRSINLLKDLLDRAGVFYKFDETLRLWTIIAGDITFYIDPKDLESLREEDYELYISKQYLLGTMRLEDNDMIAIH